MAAGALAFSVMSLLVKVVGARLPTMEVVLARSVITLAITFWLLRGMGTPLWGEARRLLLLRGLLGFVALSSFYYAVIHLPLADATVIQYTNPVFTALLAALFLSERVPPRAVFLSLVSLAGVVIMARPAFLFGGAASLPPIPVAVGVTGAVFSAAAYTTVRRLGSSEAPLVIVFYFALVSTVGAIPFAAMDFVMPRGVDWILLLGIGVSTQLGQLFLTLGLRDERAGRVMPVAYLQIVFAAIWGLWFLGEIPDRWTLAGAAVIVWATWRLSRRSGEPGAGSSEEVREA